MYIEINKKKYKGIKGRIVKTPNRLYGEYNVWRHLVLEKDNGICQLCGEQGNKLENGRWSGRLEVYRRNKNPKLKYKVSDGICLCKSCHRKLDKAEKMKEIIIPEKQKEKEIRAKRLVKFLKETPKKELVRMIVDDDLFIIDKLKVEDKN